jgi:hypothetical protein
VAAQSGQSPHARGPGGKPHRGGGEESTIRVGARTRQRTAVQQFLKACCADFFCFCLLAVEDGRPTLVLSSISQPLIERRKGSGQLWALSPEMEVLPSWTPTLTWSVARYRACITRPSQAFAGSLHRPGPTASPSSHAHTRVQATPTLASRAASSGSPTPRIPRGIFVPRQHPPRCNLGQAPAARVERAFQYARFAIDSISVY